MVVFSDANNRIGARGAGRRRRAFRRPEVGAVAGEKVEDDGGGESIYWRFESWLKRREDRLGTTIGLVGEFAAVRAEQPGARFRPTSPPTISGRPSTSSSRAIGWRTSRGHGPSTRRRVAVGLVGAEDPERVRALAHHVPAPLSVASLSRPRGGGAVGPPSGSLHGWSAGPSRACWCWPLSRCVRAAGPAVLAGQPGRRSGSGAQQPSGERSGGCCGGGPASRLLAAASAGAGQVMFLQGVAMGGMVRYARGDRSTMWSTVER